MIQTIIFDSNFKRKETIVVLLSASTIIILYGIFRLILKALSSSNVTISMFVSNILVTIVLSVLMIFSVKYIYSALKSVKKITISIDGELTAHYYVYRKIKFPYDNVLEIEKKLSNGLIFKSFFEGIGDFYEIKLNNGRCFFLDASVNNIENFISKCPYHSNNC